MTGTPAAGDDRGLDVEGQGEGVDLSDRVTGGREPLQLPGTGGPGVIRTLARAIESQLIPETYATDGRVVVVQEVSGAPAAQHAGDDSTLPKVSSDVDAAMLARLLADNTFTYRLARRGNRDDGDLFAQEITPLTEARAAALKARTWPGLPPLRGIIGAPVLRPDGTLLQHPGYDGKTGLYLAGRVQLDPVPDRPSADDVRAARAFLLDQLLVDFPWVDTAGGSDRANYLALLVTPLIRPFIRCLTPFGIVTATTPASGKTILTAGIGLLVGQRVLTWTHSEEELRKSITSVLLADQVGVIVFDNLHEGAVIDSAVLAQLITSPSWSDRGLGSNKTLTRPNDRTWLATGNNLRTGGDMASRSVVIRLDPDMPNPDQRSGFTIPNLESWVLDPINQRTILRHLLVLILDWTAAGAPQAADLTPMRQFTPWSRQVGGFLAHHGIGGFLGNAAAVRADDEGDAEWGGFLAQWHRIHGGQLVTANAVRESADPTGGHFGEPLRDPWQGTYFTDARGYPISPRALGRRLSGQVGRWRGHYVLREERDTHANCKVYRVEVKEG